MVFAFACLCCSCGCVAVVVFSFVKVTVNLTTFVAIFGTVISNPSIIVLISTCSLCIGSTVRNCVSTRTSKYERQSSKTKRNFVRMFLACFLKHLIPKRWTLYCKLDSIQSI